MEDDMVGPAEAMALFFHLMGGLGLFFMGIGVLGGVTVYRDKKE